MNRLEEICATTRAEVERRKAICPLSDLTNAVKAADAPRGFEQALRTASHSGYGLIAEIKRASPSKGLIRADFDPPAHARAYQAGGATCLSILTDKPYFQGDDRYLVAARAACDLPCLRKDFMVDPWQVYEARTLGADAILIIVAALDDAAMFDIEAAALELGMDVLIEIHDESEYARATKLKSRLLGVNNRDLKTFTTDIAASERLAQIISDDYLMVSESGINSHQDCNRLSNSGIRNFLVGESLMRQDDIAAATRQLLTGQAPIA